MGTGSPQLARSTRREGVSHIWLMEYHTAIKNQVKGNTSYSISLNKNSLLSQQYVQFDTTFLRRNNLLPQHTHTRADTEYLLCLCLHNNIHFYKFLHLACIVSKFSKKLPSKKWDICRVGINPIPSPLGAATDGSRDLLHQDEPARGGVERYLTQTFPSVPG